MSTDLDRDIQSPNDSGSEANEPFQVIEIHGDAVTFHSFTFQSPDVACFLNGFGQNERALWAQRAIEVGAHCLERASTAKDNEATKRHIDRLIHETKTAVIGIPNAIQNELLKKVGSGDGQVLKPIVDAAGTISRDMVNRITDLKQLYGTDLDPAKDSSTLGKALRSLADLLNPQRKDSVQGRVEEAVGKVTGENGALSKAVKIVVAEAVEPLAKEMKSLTLEIRGREAADQAVMQTIEKGVPFEEWVFASLQPWAKSAGAHLDHVGGDNRPGDIVVGLPDLTGAGAPVRVVVEVRDRQNAVGRKAVAADLSQKMAERSANAGIYLSHTAAGLGREIGDWADGECDAGPWVATVPEHLQSAIRWLAVIVNLKARSAHDTKVDAAQVTGQLQRARTAIDRMKNIRRKANQVRDAADEINSEADAVRDEVRDALASIEEVLRKAEKMTGESSEASVPF